LSNNSNSNVNFLFVSAAKYSSIERVIGVIPKVRRLGGRERSAGQFRYNRASNA
jgi:hypothetical protein